MIRLDYTFDASARTITFVDPVVEEYLGVIVNRADGIVIYNSFSPATIGSLAGLVLTLAYDTSLMSDADTLQIFYGDTVKAVSGPLTDTELRTADVKVTLDSEQVEISNFPIATGLTDEELRTDSILVSSPEILALLKSLEEGKLIQDPETGQIFTYDLNLAKVLGTNPIVDGDSVGAKTKLRRFPKVSGLITGLNSEIRVQCEGANTVAIQVVGTFAGTLTFQASIDGGNFITCQAQPIGGGIAVQSTTAVGAWVINCSGFANVRVLYSTYTSGSAMVFLVADVANPPAPNVAFPTTQVTTSTNLDAAFSSTALYVPSHAELGQQIVAPIVSPTQPASYVANEYARFPQTLRRLRVQSGGDKNLPFAQEMMTNRLLISNPEELSMLEQILIQLKLLNQNTMLVNNITPPSGWEEIK